MIGFRIALKNMLGAGLRSWLNISVLSFAFVVIILFNGLNDGWIQQARRDTIDWEFGKGQLWNENFDPYDPFSLTDAHAKYPDDLEENWAPVLIQQGSIYPQGRMMGIQIKGINPKQESTKLPTKILGTHPAEIPALLGGSMAKATGLKKGDQVLIRWRDKNGTFDAANITIAEVFNTTVPTVDMGQIWIDIEDLWAMTGLTEEATILIASQEISQFQNEGWVFKSQKDLLYDLNQLIASKQGSSSFMYILLLTIALLAIFDTQVLSVFRRQKEIGTYISLGMTRWQVVWIFTLEGALTSVFATFVGLVYGLPLFYWFENTGMGLPYDYSEMGIAVADRIYPAFGIGIIGVTMMIVIFASTFVSFLPSRKIAKMNPVDALKGKLQ